MKMYIGICMAVLLFCSCVKADSPVASQVGRVTSLSNHLISKQTYEIPEGIFRGVLWPSEANENFQIWVIDEGKELFWDIPAPSEFIKYEQDVTDKWEITISETTQDEIVYLAERKNPNKILKLELPIKKRKYSFSVLINDMSDEILLFMDLSEDVVDKGIFGYVAIKNE